MNIDIIEQDVASDQFLDNNNAIDRLIEEYYKRGNLIVAYDFDHTVYDTDNTGKSHEQVIELLKACGEMGFKMIVFTCRPPEEYEIVKQYLESREIPFDRINEEDPDIDFPKTDKKIFYNIFLDDRAGLKSAYEILVAVIDTLRKEG